MQNLTIPGQFKLRVLFAPRLISVLDSKGREVRLSPAEAAELFLTLSEHFAFEATAGKQNGDAR